VLKAINQWKPFSIDIYGFLYIYHHFIFWYKEVEINRLCFMRVSEENSTLSQLKILPEKIPFAR
jgi:hypothetical protein